MTDNIYCFRMKSRIFFSTILLITIFALPWAVLAESDKEENDNENPTIVFFVDHEDEPQKDFVQITLEVLAKDESLTNALSYGSSSVEDISNIAKEFCLEHAKKRSECKEAVEAGAFEIEPKYQIIKKQPVFTGFEVTHEMTIAVRSVENIGYLVDNILKRSGVTLKSFEWQALQVIFSLCDSTLQDPKTHQEAIEEGMEEAKGLCDQLGLDVGRVISIEEISDQEGDDEEQKEEEDDGEEEQGGDASPASFRFEIECVEKKSDSKTGKSKKE